MMNKLYGPLLLLILAIVLVLLPACGGHRTPTDPDPSVSRVFFVSPQNGERVVSPLFAKMGVVNFVLESPGVAREGHGYLVIAIDEDCVPAGALIPFDDRFVHIQNSTSEITLDLPFGPHELCLQASDGEHRALTLVHKIAVDVID